jgi:hypothetical protein
MSLTYIASHASTSPNGTEHYTVAAVDTRSGVATIYAVEQVQDAEGRTRTAARNVATGRAVRISARSLLPEIKRAIQRHKNWVAQA